MSLKKSRVLAIEQGRCYLVDMNPPRKSKPGKIRPVVVIQSTDTIMAGTPGIVIVPLTTQLAEPNILRVRIKKSPQLHLQKDSDALLDQVHTVDRALFIEDVGSLPANTFRFICEGVGFLLSHDPS